MDVLSKTSASTITEILHISPGSLLIRSWHTALYKCV